jgi:hypothetical protein
MQAFSFKAVTAKASSSSQQQQRQQHHSNNKGIIIIRPVPTSLQSLTGLVLHCSTSFVTSLHCTSLRVLGTSSQVTSSQL